MKKAFIVINFIVYVLLGCKKTNDSENPVLNSCPPNNCSLLDKDSLALMYLNSTLTYDCIMDIDSNEYATIKIGNQVWMAENLRTTRFDNGDSISNVKEFQEWERLKTPAWSHFRNDSLNEIPHGKLYNWFVVDSTRNICPCGWKIPSYNDFLILTEFLGSQVSKRIRSEIGWQGNYNGTNESGFSALPSGRRRGDGIFVSSNITVLYMTTEFRENWGPYGWRVVEWTDSFYPELSEYRGGFSIRCIKKEK